MRDYKNVGRTRLQRVIDWFRSPRAEVRTNPDRCVSFPPGKPVWTDRQRQDHERAQFSRRVELMKGRGDE